MGNAVPIWTQQSIFDKVWAHAKTMTRPSVGFFKERGSSIGEEACLYRSSGGGKCFVGALIPDEKYSPWMEGKKASLLSLKRPDIFEELGLYTHVSFLEELQEVHDRCSTLKGPGFTNLVLSQLKIFAEYHNLKIPE